MIKGLSAYVRHCDDVLFWQFIGPIRGRRCRMPLVFVQIARIGKHARLDIVMVKADTLMEEMNAMIVWGQYVTGTLAGKPNRLIFGNKENDMPTREQIIDCLRKSKEPYPVRIKEEADGGVQSPPPVPPDAGGVKKNGIFHLKSRP